MKSHTAIFIAIILALSAVPQSVLAATTYLETTKSTMAVGDTAVLTLRVNTEGTSVNTVEGDVLIGPTDGIVEVEEFSLASSAFGLWPRTPSLSKDGKTASFVGGTPGGFNAEGAVVLKIIVKATKVGSVTVSPQNVVLFANDGNGTRMPAPGSSITLQVGPETTAPPSNDWKGILSSDTVPPEDFSIVIGHDPSVFDDKTFAFFSAIDNQSGISYYEVSEDGAPAVRSGSTYVLINQSGTATLEVTAVDKAGNRKIAQYPAAESSGEVVPAVPAKSVPWPAAVGVVLLMVAIVAIYKKMKK